MGKGNYSFWNFLEDASKVVGEIKTSTPEELAEKNAEKSIAELQNKSRFLAAKVLNGLAVEHNQLMKLLVEKKILDEAEVEKIESEGVSQTKEWQERTLATQKAELKAEYLKYFTETKAEMERWGKK